MPEAARALELREITKEYGGLRPLRIRDLRIQAGTCSTLIGLDLPASETFVNLITGAVLPDTGTVITLGRDTSALKNSDEWLTFVEQFGFVSDRIALLDALTVAQNLAIPFGLEIDPIPSDVLPGVNALAAEVGIVESNLGATVGEAGALVRAQVRLGRALALRPSVLVLEHPTATLAVDDIKSYATAIREAWKRRNLTVVAISMNEKFGRSLGGRLLVWQPATGEFKESSRWW
jgi:ABC-type branched-subunit amino acid transport system ATPase component